MPFEAFWYNQCMSIEDLEKRIERIELRNGNVEANKAWETSISRKIVLVLMTYLVIALTLLSIHHQDPWINALIPAIGFFLSTLSLPLIKKYWIKHVYHK